MKTRSTEMVRGKRSPDSDEEERPERKRPALASVIVEALKVDNLQKISSTLEPMLRRIVSEEVERSLAKLTQCRVCCGSSKASPKLIEGGGGGHDGRDLQLHFRSRLSLPLFTGSKVEGEHGAAIHVVLLDANTGQVVTSGRESSVKLDVIVLEGDFNFQDELGWSQEVFEAHVVKEREGKRPLLTGDLQVTLKEGVGSLGDITFTDNSSWIRSRKFRLGLRLPAENSIRVREAKTEAFVVKDHRGELYKKHYPPALKDEVWRLEKIGKDGSFHKKLNKSGVSTVEDFLRFAVRDEQSLRNILGSGMSNKMWDVLMEHAKTCVLGGKLYVYYHDTTRRVGVVFNNIYELTGLISGDQYHSVDSLSENQKVSVDALVKKAYENWNQVIEYDGKSLLSFRQKGVRPTSSSSRSSSIGYPDEQVLWRQQPHDHQSSYTADFSFGTHDGNLAAARYVQPLPPPVVVDHRSSAGLVFDLSPYAPTGGQFGAANGVDGAPFLDPPHPAGAAAFDDWFSRRDRAAEDFMSEDEIRARSHEMLETEDMQQLLHFWSNGVQPATTSAAVPDDVSYSGEFTSFLPSSSPRYDEERMRSGKAVVGWLKIKAAMRWGFFVRKKAAERRRAQLVELDDDE